jgi:hypothetical protein
MLRAGDAEQAELLPELAELGRDAALATVTVFTAAGRRAAADALRRALALDRVLDYP